MNKAKTNPIETRKRWLNHFSAQSESGLTPIEYCKIKGIKPQHFYQAKYRFKEKPRQKRLTKASGFKTIKILPEVVVRPAPVMMLFRAGAVDFEISEAAPVAVVAKILQELNRGYS